MHVSAVTLAAGWFVVDAVPSNPERMTNFAGLRAF